MVSPERLESMQRSWVRLLGHYRVAAADAYPPFDVLVAAYSAPDRHYHNLEHLAEMLRVIDRLSATVEEPHALHLAVWFHDAVYDSRAKDNERRSGELAVDLLGPIGVPASTIERIVSMIWATAHTADAARRPSATRGCCSTPTSRFSGPRRSATPATRRTSARSTRGCRRRTTAPAAPRC